jgi:GntR family transcriptional regulator/MocR family aminotransferase
MKRSPDGLGPIVALDRRRGQTLHRQLYVGYRDAIVDGRLQPGQRLPSTRMLARDLQISRIPVVTAFEQLVAEGYVRSRVGAGSFVSTALPRGASPPPSGRAARPGARRLPGPDAPVVSEPWLERWGPFRVGQPALEELPADVWGRRLGRRSPLLARPPRH